MNNGCCDRQSESQRSGAKDDLPNAKGVKTQEPGRDAQDSSSEQKGHDRVAYTLVQNWLGVAQDEQTVAGARTRVDRIPSKFEPLVNAMPMRTALHIPILEMQAYE